MRFRKILFMLRFPRGPNPLIIYKTNPRLYVNNTTLAQMEQIWYFGCNLNQEWDHSREVKQNKNTRSAFNWIEIMQHAAQHSNKNSRTPLLNIIDIILWCRSGGSYRLNILGISSFRPIDTIEQDRVHTRRWPKTNFMSYNP